MSNEDPLGSLEPLVSKEVPQTAKEMNSKYKETSEAGLALSVVLC